MDCAVINKLGYSQWSEAFQQKIASARIPITVSLELTFRCNNSCLHCYCNMPASDQGEIAREMTTEQVKDLLDRIAAMGCLWLLMTGGEPMLRPDFREIYLHAKTRGLLVTLFTNGTLIDDEMADFLSAHRPFSTEITLYGATEGTYEKVTRKKGSYLRCIGGIERLVERKVPLTLKTMALRNNAHELIKMSDYADSLGLAFRFDPMINARLTDGKKPDTGPSAFRLSPDEVVRLESAFQEKMKQWLRLYEDYGGPPEDPEKLFNCGAGRYYFHVDPRGDLSMCMAARNPSYSIPAGSLDEGWNLFLPGLRELRAEKSVCGTCRLGVLCQQCPGWSQLEHGDNETPVEYLCEVAVKMAEALGI